MLRKLSLALACTAALATGTVQAEPLIGITETVPPRLVSFDSTSPGTLTGNVVITGIPLSAAGASYTPISLDFRPSNGLAYMVVQGPDSAQCQLYTLTASGAATAVGTSTYLCGTPGEIDFNPVANLIRVAAGGIIDANDSNGADDGCASTTTTISTSVDNYRLNPGTGARLGCISRALPNPPQDGLPEYVLNDAGDLQTPAIAPNIGATAYSNNTSSPANTALYAIDFAERNIVDYTSPTFRTFEQHLVLIGGINGSPSPNEGGVTTVNAASGGLFPPPTQTAATPTAPFTRTGPFTRIDTASGVTFDISGDTGAAFMTAITVTTPASGAADTRALNLFSVDLNNGNAALLGTTSIGAGSIGNLVGMTVVPASFDVPGSFFDDGGGALPLGLLLTLSGLALLRRRSLRRRAL